MAVIKATAGNDFDPKGRLWFHWTNESSKHSMRADSYVCTFMTHESCVWMTCSALFNSWFWGETVHTPLLYLHAFQRPSARPKTHSTTNRLVIWTFRTTRELTLLGPWALLVTYWLWILAGRETRTLHSGPPPSKRLQTRRPPGGKTHGRQTPRACWMSKRCGVLTCM